MSVWTGRKTCSLHLSRYTCKYPAGDWYVEFGLTSLCLPQHIFFLTGILFVCSRNCVSDVRGKVAFRNDRCNCGPVLVLGMIQRWKSFFREGSRGALEEPSATPGSNVLIASHLFETVRGVSGGLICYPLGDAVG